MNKNQNDRSAGNRKWTEAIEALKQRCEQAEAALAAIEHRNRVLGDSAPFGIMTVGPNGQVEGVNRRMRDLLPWPAGISPENINIFDFPALGEAGVSDDFRESMRSQRSLIRDYACVGPVGSCLQLRFYISPVYDGGNTVLGAIAFVENFTSFKLAQSAAVESEQRYRLLFQSAPVPMVERDASELKRYLERLRSSGVEDMVAYFRQSPGEIGRCMGLIRTVDCNDAFMALVEAENKKAVLADLPRLTMGAGYTPMAEEIVLMLAQNRLAPEREVTIETLDGRRKRVIARVMVLAGHEDTLARIVISLIDISKRVEAEDALRASERRFREQSLRDNLTGLYNQRYLYHNLPELLEAAKAYRSPLSLIFMDLDNFKMVVDAHGHLNGSRVIQEVAATIRSALVPPSYAVAYAGDEFVVVLPDYDENQALTKADELKRLIGGTVYLQNRGQAVRIQASFGVSAFPAHADDAESLLTAADAALFHIKGSGKGAAGIYGKTRQSTLGRSFGGLFTSSYSDSEQ